MPETDLKRAVDWPETWRQCYLRVREGSEIENTLLKMRGQFRRADVQAKVLEIAAELGVETVSRSGTSTLVVNVRLSGDTLEWMQEQGWIFTGRDGKIRFRWRKLIEGKWIDRRPPEVVQAGLLTEVVKPSDEAVNGNGKRDTHFSVLIGVRQQSILCDQMLRWGALHRRYMYGDRIAFGKIVADMAEAAASGYLELGQGEGME